MFIRLIARLRGLVRRRAATSELDEELQFHVAQEIEANLARVYRRAKPGAWPCATSAASRRQRKRSGRYAVCGSRGCGATADNAVRALCASPSFSTVALGILALSVGICVAVFSVVDAVILRGLSFPEADRLVAVGEQVIGDRSPSALNLVAPQNFLDWRARQRVFTDLAAMGYAGLSVRDKGEAFPENLLGSSVTASFFDVLGARPMIGRPFTADNEVAGRNHVAVIGYSLWQRRFGGRPDIVGQRVPAQLASWEIVGVMPPDFSYPVGAAEPVEVWVPYVIGPAEHVRGNDYGYYLQVIGRLRTAVTLGQARADMDRITGELAAETPRWFEDRTAYVEPLRTYFTRGVRTWMLLLLGVVVCVLLIACVNLANLMLARGTARRRELQVRAALGASNGALARTLLVESLLLSTLGAAAGALIAWTTVGVLRAALPQDLPRLALVAVNWRVLAVTIATALAIGLTLGLAPILQFRREAAFALGHQRTVTGDRRSTSLRATLIVAEIALAFVLLVGAGLFLSSFARVATRDLGFDYRNVLTVRFRPMILPGAVDPGQRPLMDVLERVRVLRGVEAAALTTNGVPLRGDLYTQSSPSPGRPRAITATSRGMASRRSTLDAADSPAERPVCLPKTCFS